MRKSLLLLPFTILWCSLSFGQAFSEGFSNVVGLTANGWNMQNLSTPIGSNPSWTQGDPVNGPFAANSLPSNSYIATNFNNVAGANTISNWLLTPTLNLSNGDVVTFYTRTVNMPQYADNLQVRLSTNGSSTNVGATNTSVGDFSTLLLEVNPNLTAAGYPNTWTQYTVTIAGLAAPTQGRIAFRYYVPNGGPNGLNSDFIGIDDIVYTPTVACNLSVTATGYNAYGGGANGTVTAAATNGTAPYIFTWSSGQTTSTVNNLSPGQYSVTVTDANGCTASANALIFNLAGPTVLSNSNVVSSNQTVNGGFTPQWVCANDTLTSGGGIMNIYLESGATFITGGGIDSVFAKSGSTIIMTGGIHKIFHEPGVNLVMNGGIPTLYPCASLVFNYTQAPANGCAPVPVCNLSTTGSGTNIDCFGASTGSATVNPAGGTAPYSYAWSPNGATTQTVNNLPAGTYTVTVTDANGCTSTYTITITEAPVLSLNTTQVNVLCSGENTGSIDLTISGGSPSYTYLWSNGSTNQDLSNLSAGTYTVTVTDATNCESSATVTISEPLALTLSTTSTNTSSGMMNGAAGTVASGGVPPYTYLWSQGGTTDAITGLGAGVYSVTVTDANGCMAVDTVTVESVGGLNTLNPELSVIVFPNPSYGKFTIQTDATFIPQSVQILTAEGRMVESLSLGKDEILTVDAQHWAKGTYWVQFNNTNGRMCLPLVKQ
jgi:hypothetical protein